MKNISEIQELLEEIKDRMAWVKDKRIRSSLTLTPLDNKKLSFTEKSS